MATFGKDSNPVEISGNENTNYGVPLALMVSLFFMIGFITVMNDVLIPSLKGLFNLHSWKVMLVQSCFSELMRSCLFLPVILFKNRL